MATIDPNGVLIYQDTDNYTPIQTALNLAQSNLSSILGASTQIVRVSSVGDRDAKATARGSISKANPFVAWRADAADGLQLEYTTNGTTWRTIADKEYYDAQDTGWVNVTLAAGFTYNTQPQVRRIGQVVYWRGDVQGAFTTSYATVAAASSLPSWAIPPRSYRDGVSPLAGNNAAIAAIGLVDSGNGARIAVASPATTAINLKGLSGYTSN